MCTLRLPWPLRRSIKLRSNDIWPETVTIELSSRVNCAGPMYLVNVFETMLVSFQIILVRFSISFVEVFLHYVFM